MTDKEKIITLERQVRALRTLLEDYTHLELHLTYQDIVRDTEITMEEYVDYRQLVEESHSGVIMITQELIQE
ncbi:hypothetical protein [Mycobacterium sp.]|uniref:hypothetical protein n=1 Tax=Mycobacterium sp. TaxID=1785 RepID=UPI003A888938